MNKIASESPDSACFRNLREAPERSDSHALPLPAQIDIVAGQELNLWFDAIWPVHARPTEIVMASEIGATEERSLRFAPTAEQAGRIFPVAVSAKKETGEILAKKSFNLRVLAARYEQTRPLQLLVLGDSLTAVGIISEELLHLTQLHGLEAIRLLGRNGEGENRHEGWGGWNFGSFLTSKERESVLFSVSDLTEVPEKMSHYCYQNTEFRLLLANLNRSQDGKLHGTVLMELRTSDNKDFNPSALSCEKGGELVPVNQDRETIVWSKAIYPTTPNPFWDADLRDGAGGLSPRCFMRANANFGGDDRIDFAFVQLGINDCYGSYRQSPDKRAASLDNIMENCCTLIKAIQDPENGYPDCNVVLSMPPIGCDSPEIYEETYGRLGGIMQGYEGHVRDFWQRLLDEFDQNPAWPQVRLAVSGLVTDRDAGYPKRDEVADGRTVQVHSNAVHPNAHGYRQIGAAYEAAFLGWLTDEETADGQEPANTA